MDTFHVRVDSKCMCVLFLLLRTIRLKSHPRVHVAQPSAVCFSLIPCVGNDAKYFSTRGRPLCSATRYYVSSTLRGYLFFWLSCKHHALLQSSKNVLRACNRTETMQAKVHDSFFFFKDWALLSSPDESSPNSLVALSSQRFTCLCLPGIGVKGISSHTWFMAHFLQL